MPSVRAQLATKVMERLEAVRVDLDWQSLIRNPRDPIGEDQMNAIIMMDGGESDPVGYTGHVEENRFEFSVGLMVIEPKDGSATFEPLLDEGFVAVCDALLDPTQIQFDGLAVGIDRGSVGEPGYGRAQGSGSARIMAGQVIDFVIRYWNVEGDVSSAP